MDYINKNDYMILRLIELAENLGLDTNLITDKEQYFNIDKKVLFI